MVVVDSSGDVRGRGKDNGHRSLCHVLLDAGQLPDLISGLDGVVSCLRHFADPSLWEGASGALPLECAQVSAGFSSEYAQGLERLAQRMASIVAMTHRSAQKVLLSDQLEIKGH